MKRLLWFLVVIVLIFGAFHFWGGDQSSAEAVSLPWEVPLLALGSDFPVGTAVISENGRQTLVEVSLVLGKLEPSATLALHLKRGTCSALGESLLVLNPFENGLSKTTLDLSRRALEVGLPLTVSVHHAGMLNQSRALGAEMYAACGTIEE